MVLSRPSDLTGAVQPCPAARVRLSTQHMVTAHLPRAKLFTRTEDMELILPHEASRVGIVKHTSKCTTIAWRGAKKDTAECSVKE